MGDLERFKGCLLGGAVGDALGYPVEFMSRQAILKRHGPRGITAMELRHGVAEISDDTQMTLFTATGLLSGAARGGGDAYLDGIAQSYRDWYRTQTDYYPLGPG